MRLKYKGISTTQILERKHIDELESSDVIKDQFNKIVISSDSKKFSEFAKISDGDHQFTKLLQSDECGDVGGEFEQLDG